jgi:hypothetical protein
VSDRFNEGLEQGISLGILKERERIIKLLKPLAEHDEEMCYSEGKQECYPEDCSAPLIQWVIALIKGEQK